MSDGFEPAVAPLSSRLRPVESRELVVDGERWRVSRREDGSWDYQWLTWPNPYGFASSGGPVMSIDDPWHAESIRAFLAEIDQQTGYLRE